MRIEHVSYYISHGIDSLVYIPTTNTTSKYSIT
jgi:hypothetical protein